MSRTSSGFTLIETLVAMLVGVTLVVAVGILGQSLIRHRVNADANSAATSLAQMKMEQLRSLPTNPVDPGLAADTYGPSWVDETGVQPPPPSARYRWQWEITDITPVVGYTYKKITVTVTHDTNSYIRCQLVTYLALS